MRGLGDWPPPTLTRPLILTFSPHAGRRDRLAPARKIWRKSLKRLNPRPETPSPRFSGERVGVRGLGDWPPPKLTPPLILTFSPHAGRRDRLAPARKIWRKSLKRLNPRPETPSPRFSGERVGVRGLGDWPREAHPAPHPGLLPVTGRRDRLAPARKTSRNTLKRLNQRPGLGRPRGLARTQVAEAGALPDSEAAAPDLVLSLSCGATPRVTPQSEGRGFPFAACAVGARPEIRRSALKTLNPRPGRTGSTRRGPAPSPTRWSPTRSVPDAFP